MGRLADIAVRAMDMYNQGFATEESFFGEDHFKYMIAASYAKLINDEYDKARLINRQATGFTFVELSPEWLHRYELTIKVDDKKESPEYSAELPKDITIFTFPFDAMFSGIQGVYSSNTAYDFVKISINDIWQMKHMPPSKKIFYFPFEGKIIFKNLKTENVGKQLTVSMIPNINAGDDEFLIPESKELEIINMALQIMIAAKNGVVVQTLNNQNSNVVLPQQLDANANKKQ